MPLRETYGLTKDAPIALLASQNITSATTTNGTGVDISKYTSQALAVVNVGALAGTLATLDAKLQESDDNSTWTDVTGAAITQVTQAGGASTQGIVINPDERKKYLRAVVTTGGTVTGAPVSVSLVGLKQ